MPSLGDTVLAIHKPANDCGTLMTLTHPPTEGDDGASVQLTKLPANLGKVNAVEGGHHQV
jgi:hypothetical protein